MKIEELVQQLIPYFNGSIPVVVGAPVGGMAPSPHALNGIHHTGEITDAQHGVRTLANAHAHSALSGIGASDHHVQTSITAGAGLTGGGAGAGVTLAVGAGNGIVVNADDVAVGVSGLGLSVGVGAVTLTSSSNPGAAAAILATDANGYLQLVRLGIGTAPGYPLHVIGAARIDGDLTFVGAQSILTTADNLTLAPYADLVLTPGGTARVKLTTGVRIQSDDYASQTTGWGVSYAGGGDFRYLYADEMHAKAFISDLEQALAGGQIISKSVAPLAADFTVPTAGGDPVYMTVESFKGFEAFRVFANNDIVRLRHFERGQATVNLCTNPSIETNTTGWSAQNAGAVITDFRVYTETTGEGSPGNYSLLTTAASGTTPLYTHPHIRYLVSGFTTTPRTCSVYARGTGTWVFFLMDGGENVLTQVSMILTGDWTRYELSNNDAAYIAFCPTTSGNLYIDGVQAEEQTPASKYCDGSLGAGYHWTGTANASTSYRGGTLDITDCWGFVLWNDTYATTQRYRFYRSSAPNAGAAVTGSSIGTGTLVLDYGTTGNGFLESNAIDGAQAENAPYHQIVSWTTHPASGQVVRTRLGNLHGIFNVANEYGLYAGDGVTDASHYLRISNTNFDIHNIAVKMSAAGTESFISMGVTPPTAADAGTGIWIDRTGMYGLTADVPQAKFDAVTGAITAGAGAVTLDVDGISILASTSIYDPAKAYNFTNASSADAGGLYSYIGAGTNYVALKSNSIAGNDGVLEIYGLAPSGYDGRINLRARSGLNEVGLWIVCDSAGNSYISSDTTFDASLGINVGSATGAGTGVVAVSAGLRLGALVGDYGGYLTRYSSNVIILGVPGIAATQYLAITKGDGGGIAEFYGDGKVVISSLAGAGNRPVYADANGKLYC